MQLQTSRLLTLAALTILGVLTLVTPAAAHAGLEGGSVFDGQVLDVAPEELFLEFNEPVVAPRAGIRVYDGGGERVDEGATFQTDDAPDLVRVGLAEDLADGTYAVTYRVTSADGHPVNGALVFSVGAEAGSGDQLVAQVFTSDADRPWAVAAAVFRWIMYVGTLLAGGAAIVLWWLRREVGTDTAATARWVGRAALAALVASAVGVLLQTILVTGDGVGALLDPVELGATLATFVGISAIIRVVAAAGVLLVARRGGLGGLAGVGAASVMLASLLLEGHTLTTGPAVVVWGAATVHILTGALWMGGLAVMATVLRARRRADDPVGAGRLVARFSSLFTLSVVAVLLAGSALSWAEVRAVRALFDTSYGLVLLAKVGTVVPLVALGAWNNRRLVPLLTARRTRSRRGAAQPAIAGGSDEVADRSRARDAAWASLTRTVRIEVGVIVAVLALTGVLVSLQPAAEAAGITGAYSENVEFPGIGQMTFTVDPNRSGPNEIHLYLLGETGRPIDITEQGGDETITMRLSQPDLDIGPIVREPILSGPGHYVLSGPELSVPGRWEITVEVATSRFDIATTTIDVVVNP